MGCDFAPASRALAGLGREIEICQGVSCRKLDLLRNRALPVRASSRDWPVALLSLSPDPKSDCVLRTPAFGDASYGHLRAQLTRGRSGLFSILPCRWRYYHFLPTQSQTASCELPLLAMRLTGTYVLSSQEVGVVCFPSFHVVWAILFAAALWGFRWLRIPVALVAAMVILSTMTTGWHYFADVLGGVLLAIISILSAKRLTQPTQTIRRQPSGRRPVGLFLTTLFNRAKSGEQQPGAARGQILSQLSDLPGRQLIIVRYRPDHAVLAPDWVDNDADIDHTKIIWARDMGPAENEELIRYYGARGAWLLEADVIPPKFAPYPSRCDGQLVLEAAQKMGNSPWRKAVTNNAE